METPLVRVMALHALAYCERLFYLEEVEEIRVADARVYAGRTLHEALDEAGEFVEVTLESEGLGIRGKVDALRTRDGALVPYEHKRGRSRPDEDRPSAWPSDRLQIGAYALLLEESLGRAIPEGRIRYHGDNTLVRLPIDEPLRREVAAAVVRARELSLVATRPPVAENERLCERCSLAPICLPEESRRIVEETRSVTRMFPRDDERRSLHVLGHGTRVGRRGHELVITPLEEEPVREPVRDIASVTVHGFGSVSAQALQLCADHGVAVHWFGVSGQYVGTFWADEFAVQRRIRQFEGLREPAFTLGLARRLVQARIESQLRFVLRATQGTSRDAIAGSIVRMRTALAAVARAESRQTLLGLEGGAAAAYFAAVPSLLVDTVDPRMRPEGRSRRPPLDPFNALLSFGYGLVLRQVAQAVRVVGLDGAFGLYHQPRSSAPPLALDLLELFRVPVVDMAVVAAVNRRQFTPDEDFRFAGGQVWLTADGRKKAIELFERRLQDEWRHPILGYSLSWRRHMELEVRLLEKEWSGEPGLFARTRLR